ncbi:carbohydrate ABC transporter permease [Microbacterium sp.]|uniref:carbohydrate ABC transporter permease n=1 Tax=Microbacterium sp. TaxID=51671 RepID=UPI0039E45E43
MTSAPTGSTVAEARPASATARRRKRFSLVRWTGWIYLLPALGFYVVFVLVPFGKSVQYSFYDWNGVTTAAFVGFDNYIDVFTNPARLGTLANAFKLIFFYTVLSIALGLLAAVLTHKLSSRLAGAARTILFLPQVIPLVGAGIAWTWIYSRDGMLNQLLATVGLGSITRAWLADFDWALVAVGFVGTWVLTGLCAMLLSAGIGKIDPSLYDAARVDGAGPVREFFSVTLPGLRPELAVCITITMIAALASFDVIYVMTGGGPGRSTMVPGVEIFQLAFTQSRVGAASAMGVVLMGLVLTLVLLLQRLTRERS